jgi:formate C-acetyltransferase
MAARCRRVSWDPPAHFVDALQLLQIVHMALACLVGARDITPARIDQYLWPLYRADVGAGRLTPEDATVLLAMFFLRLSQMAGNGTDFDDNVRRSPCMYSHIYVTVGGSDAAGGSCVNELSYVVADAIRLLGYKEPTLLVRHHPEMDPAFADAVAGLIVDRLPVTVYNDAVVVRALISQGVPETQAFHYAHSACHNSLVPRYEAGSGPGGFHNIPARVLLAMNAGRDLLSGEQAGAPTPEPDEIGSFETFLESLRLQIRHLLAGVRRHSEQRWREGCAEACPLLHSSLMRVCLEARAPAWQAAPISHLNHYFAGLATVVDALLAVRHLVFVERSMTMGEYLQVLRDDWAGREALRERVRRRLPRYGQDDDEASAVASRVGRMWVEEVEAASSGLERLEMWPGFYSHMYHARQGARTPATPDGRVSGDPLSENLAPSVGTPLCTPTTILKAMSHLPLDRTPSGAAILTLPGGSFSSPQGVARLRSLMASYFSMGGLHLHVNAVDVNTLQEALETPERFEDLMVRVAGFSAYFVQLSEDVQQDVIRRHSAAS